jgi:hypothetical protein
MPRTTLLNQLKFAFFFCACSGPVNVLLSWGWVNEGKFNKKQEVHHKA